MRRLMKTARKTYRQQLRKIQLKERQFTENDCAEARHTCEEYLLWSSRTCDALTAHRTASCVVADP